MNNAIGAKTELSKEDKRDIESSLKEASPISPGPLPFDDTEIPDEVEEKAVVLKKEVQNSLIDRSDFGIGIEGLQDVPTAMIPVPFMKLVQGTSKNIELENGEDAPVGSFYLTDLQVAFKDLTFVMLRVKHQVIDFEREIDGQMKMVPTKQLLILGMDLDTEKLFILTLSVMSFSNFGRLIAKFKDQKVNAVWQYQVHVTSEKMENKKGKFQIANFQIGEKLTEDQIAKMQEKYGQYGGVIDREDLFTQDEAE